MLIRDQADWPMPGGRPPSLRRLRVWRVTEGSVAAVITESGPGVSVTNVARQAYAAVAAQFTADAVRVFEHYPDAGQDSPEHVDEIHVGDGRLRWRRCTDELVELVGPEVLLGPQPRPERRAAPAPRHCPAGPGLAAGTVVRGEAPGWLVTVVGADGQVLGVLPHWPRHSTGFSWGYTGSGPAELARCILIAVLGVEARCRRCAGTGYLVYDDTLGRDVPERLDETAGTCGDCDEGLTVTPVLYQQFKEDVVAHLPDQEWTLPVDGIRAWLAGRAH